MKDKSCLVSEHGIEYSAKFSYYEKNRAVPKKKVVKSELGETTYSSAPTSTVAAPQNPAVAALEQKAKAKIKQAAALQTHVKNVVIPETQKQVKEAKAATAQAA